MKLSNSLSKPMSILAFSAVYLLAQGPGGSPPDPATMIQMRISFLTSMLGLTSAQQAKATTIFTDANTAGQAVRSNLQTVTQSVSDAVKKNDTEAIDTLAANAGTLHGQLLAIDSKAQAAFYAILTADQQTKYDSMPRGGPGGGGPGGPGGMGMGAQGFSPAGRIRR